MNRLETLGLIELTTQRQADNGTRCWLDPQTGYDYLSYESGYCRKSYSTRSYYTGKMMRQIYQINLTRKTTHTYKFGQYETTERILIPSQDARIDRIAKVVVACRKNKSKINS